MPSNQHLYWRIATSYLTSSQRGLAVCPICQCTISCIYLPDAYTSKDISIKNVCPQPMHLVLDEVLWLFANALSPAYLPNALFASRHFCRDAFQHTPYLATSKIHTSQFASFVCINLWTKSCLLLYISHLHMLRNFAGGTKGCIRQFPSWK